MMTANLMIDNALIKRICGIARIENSVVLEIGAGTGNLTQELLARAKFVYAVEKNPDFVSVLRDKFSGRNNIEIIHADALKMDFPKFDNIVSNIPYEISRPVTIKILKHPFRFATTRISDESERVSCNSRSYLIVYQKEFAQKLAAKPGDENYRAISVMAQSVANIEIIEDVPPSAFEPQPKVWSSVVRIEPFSVLSPEYVKFVNLLFSQRNKKLKNTVSGAPEELAGLRPWEIPPSAIKSIFGSTP